MRTITAYAIIKVRIAVADDTSDDDICQRVSAEADYDIEHEDDVAEIVDADFISLSTEKPPGV